MGAAMGALKAWRLGAPRRLRPISPPPVRTTPRVGSVGPVPPREAESAQASAAARAAGYRSRAGSGSARRRGSNRNTERARRPEPGRPEYARSKAGVDRDADNSSDHHGRSDRQHGWQRVGGPAVDEAG